MEDNKKKQQVLSVLNDLDISNLKEYRAAQATAEEFPISDEELDFEDPNLTDEEKKKRIEKILLMDPAQLKRLEERKKELKRIENEGALIPQPFMGVN